MSDIMRPIPFDELLNRIFAEYKQGSIFGIKKENFFVDKKRHSTKIFNDDCSSVLGPAAGPHTQLAQNIITSYLVGARFMELKTVQIMDTLEIDKPCIDARDEAYNVEWSTEYTLKKARDEYYKAWIICHLLEALMNGGEFEKPTFLFNMSVGYNFEGIKNPRMQEFIDRMIDASEDSSFNTYLKVLDAFLKEGGFADGTPFENAANTLKGGLSHKISPKVCTSLTLSTMHGCPPEEIEQIAKYMLEVKHISTFVKLNPTLLGYDRVRAILDSLGYDYLHLKRETFEKDLQYSDAVEMLHRLINIANKENLKFGVKLTNTLASVNDQGKLPGAEMYMSGRALYPISTNLAAIISKEYGGKLPISYSGGANIFTAKKLFEAGIRPITLATDMLHPGGYNKMKQIAELLDNDDDIYWNRVDGSVDVEKITEVATEALDNKFIQKAFRGKKPVKIDRPLPLEDCFVAPCDAACPVHQDVAKYVAETARGEYKEAMKTLYAYNALPNITCNICDHKCQYNCTRLDYDGTPIHIRDMKKIAVTYGMQDYERDIIASMEKPTGEKVAVVGAGPAGLAASIFLSLKNFRVDVFEREAEAGGTVRYVIPDFRIAKEAIKADVQHAEDLGVQFNYNVKPEDVTIKALRNKGYKYIFYAIGAEKENSLKGSGDTSRMVDALAFLRKFRNNRNSIYVGKSVVVVGAGNSAMDAARAAKMIPSVENVTVVYRRTIEEMPADKEEYEDAVKEGINFEFLAAPLLQTDGNLECVRMTLGEKDASGRRSPIPTSERFNIKCDYIVAAIGEKVDSDALKFVGVPTDEKGRPIVDKFSYETNESGVYALGDMAVGASSVIRAVQTARQATNDLIIKTLGASAIDVRERDNDKDKLSYAIELAERRAKVTTELPESGDPSFALKEGKRCLDCGTHCEKCVDVCPNRANAVISFVGDENEKYFSLPFQVVHIDAYCNECGNCATFCPYMEGKPYQQKFTIFSREEDIRNSRNDGFYLHGSTIMIRENGVPIVATFRSGEFESDKPISDKVKALIHKIVSDYGYLLGPVGD